MTSSDIDQDYVLCQDCGHVEFFSMERHRGVIRCDCGGDFCGCDLCSGIARLTRQFSELSEAEISSEAEQVKCRAPGSSEELHPSDERKHGRSEHLNSPRPEQASAQEEGNSFTSPAPEPSAARAG